MFQAIYNAPVPPGVYTTTWKVKLSMDLDSEIKSVMSGGIWLWEARLVQVGWGSSTWRLTHNSSHRPGRHVAALRYKLFSTPSPTSRYENLPFFAVENADGTPEFHWEEPQPNSEEATRLCGTKSLLNFSIQYVHHFPGLLVAEERLDAVSTFVTRLQESAEQIKDGFQIEHRGGHYDFTATFTDR